MPETPITPQTYMGLVGRSYLGLFAAFVFAFIVYRLIGPFLIDAHDTAAFYLAWVLFLLAPLAIAYFIFGVAVLTIAWFARQRVHDTTS